MPSVVLTGKNAQRLIAVGQSGTGKTTNMITLAEQAARAVWIDVKRENDPGWPVVFATEFLWPEGDARAHALAALFEKHGPRLTVQLSDLPGTKDLEQLDAAAEAAFRHSDTLFVLDDAMGVLESAPTYYLNRILTMGRSRGVGFIGITQRVHRVPLVFLTEANHIVAWAVLGESDVDRLARDGHPDLSGVRHLAQGIVPNAPVVSQFMWLDRQTKSVQLFDPIDRAA